MRGIVFFLIALPVILLVAFYFYGSSATLNPADYNTVIAYQSDHSEEDQVVPDSFRVITYNIGYLSGMTNNRSVNRDQSLFISNLKKSIDVLKSYDPDLIAFQEIDYDADRSFNVDQANELAKSLNFSHGFHSVNWDKRYVPFPYGMPRNHFGKVVSGQSILSKYLLGNAFDTALVKPMNAPFYYNAFYLDRLVQISDWEVGDRTIKVMNLHLEAFDKETRQEHAKTVRSLYEKYYQEMPVLIMGDFNSRLPHLDDDAMTIIMKASNIRSAVSKEQYALDSASFYTFSSATPVYMIDYVLYNDNFIESMDAKVIQDVGEVSDHLPVLFDFTFRD